MSEAVEIELREAEAADSAALIRFLNLVGQESHFLTLDEVGILMSEAEMAEYLEQMALKDNNAYFLALAGDEIVGVLAVTADFHYRVRHIGEIFVAVRQDFQGLGLGSLLFEMLLDWTTQLGLLKRLELTVQARNAAARHLYEKFGFALESVRVKGARDETGKLIDVCVYVRFFED